MFKETEMGQIPQEWEIARLGKYCRVQGGFAFRSSDYIEEGVPLVRISNIKDEFVDCSDSPHLPVDYVEQYPEFVVTRGDVLIAMSGATTGKVGTYNNVEPVLLNQRVGRYIVIDENKILQKFLRFLVDLPSYRNKALVDANGAAQPNVAPSRLEHVIIAIPPLLEQRKIAEILSTVDEAIEKTDATIRETQQLKKGLMQKLFTEGIRHSRFKETKIGQMPEEWEVVRLAKVSEIRFSNVDKKSYPGEIPVHLCNYLDVYNNEYIDEKIDFMEATATTAEIEKFSLNKGDVIITKDSETADDIAVPSVVIEELNNVLCGYHLALLQPNAEKVDSIFFSKLLSSTPINNQFVRLAQGLTRFGLNVSSIQNAIIPLPSLDEQHQIAQILSKVDLKTEREQAFKEELEQLKKGLMHVLLTGKVRVKV